MIAIEDFGDFFEAVHGAGRRPFAWQEDLLRHLVDTGTWPEQIVAPTGAGKSSVVEIHVFAVALFSVGAAKRVPRRLAVVVNRRALTDSHAARAARIRCLLEDAPADDSILRRVRDALVGLRVCEAEDRAPLVTATMRGAAATDRAWLNAPEACAVLCMTPAMWASGLLFHSYGASRLARPRLAGMLALDAAVVVDEAHLSRQILVTARRVGQLCAPSAQRLGVPALQTVEMTATPSGDATDIVGVTSESLAQDVRLAARVRAPKSARYVETTTWPTNGKMTKAYRDELVSQVLATVKDARELLPEGPRTVGCVLNRVDSAVQVTKALDEQGLNCRLWVGRMRPWDLERMRREEPGLFDVSGAQSVDVLVATQTIEVGVDLDLTHMVTELAPASALAQRAGRVNRLGQRDRAWFTVIGPPREAPLGKDVLPYRKEDLLAARTWILDRIDDGDLSPLTVSEKLKAPPAESPRRLLYQRPEPWDAALWSKTSMRLVVEPELDLWIRDDLDPETETVGLVLRDLKDLPDATECETLLTEVPPQDREVYPMTLATARKVVQRLIEDTDHPLDRSVLWRDGAILPQWQTMVLEAERGDKNASRVLRPGDILILDASVPLLASGVVTEDGEDLGESVPYGELDGVAGVVTDPDELRVLAALESDELCDLLPGETVVWPPGWDEEDEPAWMVRRSSVTPDDDSDDRSTWSVSHRVLLADHNAAVAARAGTLADGIGIEPKPATALREAGSWHDLGKNDVRFQRLLWRGDPDGREALAKSGGRSTPLGAVRRAWADAGLPAGWRHELVSAAAYWEQTEPGGVERELRDLVTRLIGTSHGRGRPLFDHDPVTAGPDHADALEELVGEGEWESLIARTDRQWGPWGTAYLEALLRAADCTISMEGK
ncbi:type I-U CRISPR-associated helicase/endonuclease Cas3 [Actinomyces oris]|uniref:type I-G CRISPR-associated helicase/endonuclease Cas3g n=1 Tax=Actinomyces oris TaxID=544580 RepID=UPI00094CBF68|nr:type I-U CRISPR-associated helicase/endonuclease Cas3 [Actinomyces oris]OLO68469.1 type I-U CRISPR-associated helicase/endonuclease Cas3 [Actinomyces oris]